MTIIKFSDKPKPKPLTHWSQETGGQERANNSSASLNTLSSYGTCYSQDPGEKYRWLSYSMSLFFIPFSKERDVEFCHQQTGGTQQGWWNEYYGENNDFWAKKQRDGEQYWTYGSFVVNSSVIIFTPKLCALLLLKQNALFYHGCFSLCFLVFDKFYYPLLVLKAA